MRELLLRSVEKYGGDYKLVDRLLLYEGHTYFTWVIRSIVDEGNVYASLYALAEILEMPETKLRYAYFSAASTTHSELAKLPEYDYVMETLLGIYDVPALWLSMEAYCYRQFKRLCIEELVSRDETVLTIMEKLNASHGLVYNVRSAYIKRELKSKENEFI